MLACSLRYWLPSAPRACSLRYWLPSARRACSPELRPELSARQRWMCASPRRPSLSPARAAAPRRRQRHPPVRRPRAAAPRRARERVVRARGRPEGVDRRARLALAVGERGERGGGGAVRACEVARRVRLCRVASRGGERVLPMRPAPCSASRPRPAARSGTRRSARARGAAAPETATAEASARQARSEEPVTAPRQPTVAIPPVVGATKKIAGTPVLVSVR